MKRTRQFVIRNLLVLLILCSLPIHGFSASPVEQSILWIRDNAEAYGIFSISSATVVTQDDSEPIYLYTIVPVELLSGDSSIATFCSQIRFEEAASYFLFLAPGAFELAHINRRIEPKFEGLCDMGIVGGGDGSYLAKSVPGDELVILAAFPWGILNDDCIRVHGVEEKHSRDYVVAINFEFLKKRLLNCDSVCECGDCFLDKADGDHK